MNIAIAVLTLAKNVGKSNVTYGTGGRAIDCTAVHVFQSIGSQFILLWLYRIFAFLRQRNLCAFSGFHAYCLIKPGSRHSENIVPLIDCFSGRIADSRLADRKFSLSAHLHVHRLLSFRRTERVPFNLHSEACKMPPNSFHNLIRPCRQALQLYAFPSLQHHRRIRVICFSPNSGNQLILVVPYRVVVNDVARIGTLFGCRRSNRHPSSVVHLDVARILRAGILTRL